MEPNESRSLDFKTLIKQSLTPHLNLSNNEEQNNAPQSLNPSNMEEQSDTCHKIVNPKFPSVGKIMFLSDSEKSENVLDITSSIMAKSVRIDVASQSFIDSFDHYQGSKSQDGEVNDSENSAEMKEDITNIITADAEKLAKSFKKLKIKKKKKYSKMAESNQKIPNWNMSIKKVLDPNSVLESSLETPEEVVDKEPHLLHPELLGSVETHPWTFHKLSTDESLPSKDLEEVSSQSPSGNCNKKHYTNEEKKVIKILRSARTFKPLKFNLNDFDGAGANCFKDSKIKSSIETKKPKNVPPPGGYVCIKPLTIEDVMKRPPNLIIDECWDYEDDEW